MSEPLLANDHVVLVVDDDSAIRDLLTRALREAGFRTLEAADGRQALKLLEDHPVSLMVLDQSMPRLGGAGVIRAVRADEHARTRTLPIILVTGMSDEHEHIAALDAGADDFLAKPVRANELVARVRARLRSQAEWSGAIERDLRRRSAMGEALGRLKLPQLAEEAAEAFVAELASGAGCDFIAVLQVVGADSLREITTFNRLSGTRRGGGLLGRGTSSMLLERVRHGAWVSGAMPTAEETPAVSFQAASPAILARAPLYSGDTLVGLLVLGASPVARDRLPIFGDYLLAAAIDYASILSQALGPILSKQSDRMVARVALDDILASAAFHPVFQPIVDLRSRTIVGYEALTRFDDGTPPDRRFAEAAALGLGKEYELATIEAALVAASDLRDGTYISLNVSPGVILSPGRALKKALARTSRRIVLELTEHESIVDYRVLRAAIGRLGSVRVAVDDAGAGYASLRHILELGPTFAKLDLSIVRGIDASELRQALVAGLSHFASRSGCLLIAEGVETEAEARTLETLGMGFGQGYLFGRPEPIAR